MTIEVTKSDISNPSAIETPYKGYRFRSRLEARWAVAFDALGLTWAYEPEGYDLGNGTLYLPDFLLNGLNLWVEINGTTQPDEDALRKCQLLSRHTQQPVTHSLVILGII